MLTDSRKIAQKALAALVVAVGVAGIVGTAGAAERSAVAVAAYAGARVDTVFDLVADLPVVAEVMVPLAAKGDLPVPVGCMGMSGDAQDECMDVAYELDSAPSLVVATRSGTTTTLERMDQMTVAGAGTVIQVPHSE